jgi:hypothetical protein
MTYKFFFEHNKLYNYKFALSVVIVIAVEDIKLDSISLSTILFGLFILAWILVTYKFGDLKNWKLYYPTILFFWCGNLIGFSVFHNHRLWEYKSSFFSHTTVDLIQMVIIFTCTTILFLQYNPDKMSKKVLYILLWVFIYSSVEWFFHLFGVIVYNHGWNIWWSVIHNIYQFILLRVHYKRPILAWTFSFVILAIMTVAFK